MTRGVRTAWAAAVLAAAFAGACARAGAPSSSPAGPESRAVRRAAGGEAEAGRVGRDAGGSWRGWMRTLAALVVVVALIFLVRWGQRRIAPGARSTRLPEAVEVLGRTGVSARQQLLLVRLGRRIVLVGCGPEGMSTLSEVTDPDEISALLDQSGKGRRGAEPAGDGGKGGAE